MKKATRNVLIIGLCMMAAGVMMSVAGLVLGGSFQQIMDNGLWNLNL